MVISCHIGLGIFIILYQNHSESPFLSYRGGKINVKFAYILDAMLCCLFSLFDNPTIQAGRMIDETEKTIKTLSSDHERYLASNQ